MATKVSGLTQLLKVETPDDTFYFHKGWVSVKFYGPYVIINTENLKQVVEIRLDSFQDGAGTPISDEASIVTYIGGLLEPIATTQQVASYSNLAAGAVTGQLAYVESAQGTQWLPKSYGGTYYPSGWYLWNGSIWVSGRNDLVNQLQLNIDGLGGKANVSHTHVKANITDFSDADYATEEQGVLASASIQPNDNVSELINDAGYLNFEDLGIDGLEDYFDELIYVNGLLTTIETYEDNSKTVNLFTKSFTYTGGVLTQISLLNIATNVTETKNLSYDVSGNLITITKT
jgi:hypothetical protein